MIGEDVLPTGDSPTTRLVTLVGHSEYRPPSLSAKVALFKKGFSPHMIHNPDHVGTSYLSSSVKFIYIADSVFLRRLLVFSIGKPVGNRYQAASFCSSLKSLRNISPFLSRVQAT